MSMVIFKSDICEPDEKEYCAAESRTASVLESHLASKTLWQSTRENFGETSFRYFKVEGGGVDVFTVE